MLRRLTQTVSGLFGRRPSQAARPPLRLQKTCSACPEQYDAYLGDEQVGYLRLRHGEFTVQCPDVKGEIVYRADPSGDGEFADDEERDYHLRFATKAILDWVERGRMISDPAPAPDVRYEVIPT